MVGVGEAMLRVNRLPTLSIAGENSWKTKDQSSMPNHVAAARAPCSSCISMPVAARALLELLFTCMLKLHTISIDNLSYIRSSGSGPIDPSYLEGYSPERIEAILGLLECAKLICLLLVHVAFKILVRVLHVPLMVGELQMLNLVELRESIQGGLVLKIEAEVDHYHILPPRMLVTSEDQHHVIY
ncbi:hypothetical protein Pfo_000675, partial [Paulownia fortunei]